MKSITVNLEYDERVLHEGLEVESKLEEQLYGTGFQLISIKHEPSKEVEKQPVKPDKDSTSAGGQSSPPQSPPNKQN
ncbi:hypothetical protein [Fictibacillus barbaricus]|uniref:Uncharacterized protein n=1 Tax=Fictibacillus barbaricus TaxID=182136 RepID=A0ABU1TW37_9BACL|nr:hypothetical protein [Fictibacillus barbaricus]MDR7071413.1 hypothetical protein [Fictibacillus barbaricus]